MIPEGLTFDDVLLIPRRSRVFSRKDVSLKTKLSKNITLNIPLVSANMDTVTEAPMARAMAEAGGIGIIHRFLPVDKQVEAVRKVKRAENIIIEDPVTASPDDTIGDVRELMGREGISGVLVVSGKGRREKLVGILTARDFLFQKEPNKPVRSVMTKNVITAPPSVSFGEAETILYRHKIEKLPLVSESGALSGLITLRDILKKANNPQAAKDKKGRLLVGAAVGVKSDAMVRAQKMLAVGADVIVLDVAHGHNERALSMIRKLRKAFGGKIELVAGNIATKEAAEDLIRAGADGLKVGVGPGAACTTRLVTGVGVPQLSAISDVIRVARRHKVPVIADGGIKNSGHFAKALAAGADSAMIGNLLAGCKEAPGEYVMDGGVAYKYYRGMASYEAGSEKTILDGGGDGFARAPEGASGKVSYRGEAAMVLADLTAGLRSSMSYLGAHTLAEFHKNAGFIRITAAGQEESRPHGLA